jgi:hypothetical protein
MRTTWLVLLVLLASCAAPKQEPKAPLVRATSAPHSARIGVRHTLPPVPPDTTPTIAPTAPTKGWQERADTLQAKAQLAINDDYWEDTEFKKEAYKTAREMIAISTGKLNEDSKAILKHFRWGMEFMDRRQLKKAIDILETYN